MNKFLTVATGIAATLLAAGLGASLVGLFKGSPEDKKSRTLVPRYVGDREFNFPYISSFILAAGLGAWLVGLFWGSSEDEESRTQVPRYVGDREFHFHYQCASTEDSYPRRVTQFPFQCARTEESYPRSVTQVNFNKERFLFNKLVYKTVSPKEKRLVDERLEEANRLPQSVIDLELWKASECTRLTSECKKLKEHKKKIKQIRAGNLDRSDGLLWVWEQIYLKENNLGSIELINRWISELKEKAAKVKPRKIGRNNLHFLEGDLLGLIALDVDEPDENGSRGPRRVVAKYKRHERRFCFVAFTEDHDYKSVKRLLTRTNAGYSATEGRGNLREQFL